MGASRGGEGAGYAQIVPPNLNQESGAGWCLKFTQDSFGAPVMYTSATLAANGTKHRNSSRTMPNVAVPVWFDHRGTYQGTYANWGHVVVWVPGRGFLSSPASGFGQLWLSSIEAVERTFNAKYRFWSLDINTLLVAEPAKETTPDIGQEEVEEMKRAVFHMVGDNYFVVIGEPLSGWKFKYETRSTKTNAAYAELWQTGDFYQDDKSMVDMFEKSLDEVRQGK